MTHCHYNSLCPSSLILTIDPPFTDDIDWYIETRQMEVVAILVISYLYLVLFKVEQMCQGGSNGKLVNYIPQEKGRKKVYCTHNVR